MLKNSWVKRNADRVKWHAKREKNGFWEHAQWLKTPASGETRLLTALKKNSDIHTNQWPPIMSSHLQGKELHELMDELPCLFSPLLISLLGSPLQNYTAQSWAQLAFIRQVFSLRYGSVYKAADLQCAGERVVYMSRAENYHMAYQPFVIYLFTTFAFITSLCVCYWFLKIFLSQRF